MMMTGQKLVEARLGTDRSAPFNRVSPGDTLYIRSSGQGIIGKTRVQRVDQYTGLTPNDLDHIRRIYDERVRGDDVFWASNRNATYATLITLGPVAMVPDESSVHASLLEAGDTPWRVLHDQSISTRRAA